MLRIYTQFMKACNFCRKNPLYSFPAIRLARRTY